MQKIKAEIHLGNIRRNAEKFSALTGEKICAVVKANAYGHGAEEVVNALEGIVDQFAVAIIEEGLSIRTAACGKDVLVFTPPLSEEEAYALAVNEFIASVSDLWTAKLVSRVCRKRRLPLKVHLKINTGMNRYGMNLSMLGKVCKFLSGDPFVRVVGIYSHLYCCETETAIGQRELFARAVAVCKRYFPSVIAHLGGTYAALCDEKFAFDMIRIGIGLYGYLPQGLCGEEKCRADGLNLQKGMTVCAMNVVNRKISYGGFGYGKPRTEAEIKETKRLSVCRFGYADGFLRKRVNGVCDQQENVNALCMDVCLRKNGKQRGQKVLIMSDADEVAKATGTISYEVLCAATRRAEFVYDNE